MAITMCPDRDDNHAPFPHRLVIPLSVKRVHGETIVRMSLHVYVICAHCDHWIERPAGRCRCRERCHEWAAKVAKEKRRSELHSR